MNSVVDIFLKECQDVIDRYPVESRWDILSAILSEPKPFWKVMARVLDDARGREGKIVRPLCSGMVGAMLLGNYEDGGFLHNPYAGIGQNVMSQPGWLGNEEKEPIQKHVVIFAAYADEIPAIRAAALTEGLFVVEEFAFKGTVEVEQP